MLAVTSTVELHSGANELLEGLLIDLVTFMEIDGTSGIAFETGIEKTRRIFQCRSLGKGQLDVCLIGFTRADHAIVIPDWHTGRIGRLLPLPFLKRVRVSLKDEFA